MQERKVICLGFLYSWKESVVLGQQKKGKILKRVGLRSAVLRFLVFIFRTERLIPDGRRKHQVFPIVPYIEECLILVFTRTADFLPDCSSIWRLNYAIFSIFAKHFLNFFTIFFGGGGNSLIINKLNQQGDLLAFGGKNHFLIFRQIKTTSYYLLTISLSPYHLRKKRKNRKNFVNSG